MNGKNGNTSVAHAVLDANANAPGQICAAISHVEACTDFLFTVFSLGEILLISREPCRLGDSRADCDLPCSQSCWLCFTKGGLSTLNKGLLLLKCDCLPHFELTVPAEITHAPPISCIVGPRMLISCPAHSSLVVNAVSEKVQAKLFALK